MNERLKPTRAGYSHRVRAKKVVSNNHSKQANLKSAIVHPKSLGFWGDFRSGVMLPSRGDDVRCNTEKKRGLR